LRKYNSNFSETDEEIFFSTLEEYASSEELTKAFKEKLSISFLQTDVKKILDAKVKLTGEKTLTLSRLESFQEKNTLDLNGKTQALIELSLTESLRQHSSLSTQQINTISKRISLKLFAEANNIL